MPLHLIHYHFIDQYNLKEKTQNGYIYMEIIKGIYSLPQAGILANKLFKKLLKNMGIMRSNTHQVSGSMSPIPYNSH